MAYGAAIGDKTKKYAFSLTTPRGIVKLAADDEESEFHQNTVMTQKLDNFTY
jgi:hypothetical protein